MDGVQAVTCVDCGARLPLSFARAEHRRPCDHCGGTRVAVAVAVASTIEVDDAVSLTAGTTNTAATRRRQLENAITDVEAAVAARAIGQTQEALKRALEAIHELADCLRRGEWRQANWDAKVLGLWRGLIGARNVAHHYSSPIVALHSDGQQDEQLVWAIEPAVISAIDSKTQASEYRARLDGQPVLPGLREVAAGVSSAIP